MREIEAFVEDHISGMDDVFLIEVKATAANKVTVLLDADGGLTIATCTKINRALYKFIESNGLFPGNDFALEVSSPGVDKPLKLKRQYMKNISRKLEVTLDDGTKVEGTLNEVDDEGVVLIEEHGKGKNKVTKVTKILFEHIKQAIVLITF